MQKITYYWDDQGSFSTTTEYGMVVITQNYAGSSWNNYERLKIILDENGNMVEFYEDQGSGNTWKRYYRFTASYDKNHNQIDANQTFWTADTGWWNRLRWENVYDENSQIISQTYYDRAEDNVSWTKGNKIEWEYDAAGNMTKETTYFCSNGVDYTESQRFEYEFDESGNLTSARQAYRGTYVSQYEYTYDENGNQTGYTYSTWKNGEWQASARQTNTFENGQILLAEIESWDSVKGWYVNARAEYTYHEDTIVLTEYRYNKTEDQILPSTRTTQVNNEASFIDYVFYETYGANLNSYYDRERYLYTYDENWNILTQRYERANAWNPDWTASVWQAYVDYTFTYDENGNGATVNAAVRNPNEDFFIPYNMHQYHIYIMDEAASYAEVHYLNIDEYVHAEEVTLNRNTAEMLVNETLTLAAAVGPENVSNPEVYWYSSDSKIVDVDVNGLIRACSEGQAIITARSLDQGIEASCLVSVLSEMGEVSAPVFLPGSGEIFAGTSVSIVTTTPNASIYYTTDGSEPSTSSTLYTTAIEINEDMTLKAIAVLDDKVSPVSTAEYTVAEAPVNVEAPVFRPGAGSVVAGTKVSITSSTSGAKIYYTSDGSDPTTASTLYTEPIEITEDVTLRAIAVAGSSVSGISTAAYTVEEEVVTIGKPLFNPAGGEVAYGTKVSLSSSTPGVQIYYTLDKSEPTENSTLYTAPIEITENITITAIAVLGENKSEIAAASFTTKFEVADPVFSLPEGTYGQGSALGIACATQGAEIYYTDDGSAPDETSTLFGGVIVLEETTTFKAVAIFRGVRSNIVSATYTVIPTANETQEEQGIRIYPNPNNGRFQVDIPQKADLHIFSLSGKLIFSQENMAAGCHELYLNPKGVYIIRATFENRSSSCWKVVVR